MDALVGGRFVIESEAGAGAMARVYRARDVSTNETVALKILNSVGEYAIRRFEREVGALTDVNHAGIVKYVAHGTTKTGHAFLAMEWLAGQTLEARLERGPLSVEDSLALGRVLASALGAAHARGLVHRDVKPGNIFLVDGDPSRAKLLDFGLARDTLATFGLTNTGDLLGTPLFMSPEQASCELDIDARCDVYALGAVLYNCLSGRPPLVAPNLPGLLAKIVLEEPAPIATAPRHVARLVAHLLAKKRGDRPENGAAAESAIAAATAGLSEDRGKPVAVLPSREQRVVSILLATNARVEHATLDATLGAHGGVLGLADGSTMVVFSGPETPGDQAVRAARYALGLRTNSGVVSLATGQAVLSGVTPMGEVIDRASQQLAGPAGTIRIDAETSGLVEGRFELASDESGAHLVRERSGELDPVRTLLGKPTRCIGRDRELAAIEGYFAECVTESVARSVIVIAEAGVGKSRLAHEVQRRLATHSEAPAVIFVRCESITERSPFAAAAAALRRAPDGLAAATSDEFLAEIAGTPVTNPSDRMQAARENPALMFDQIRNAWTAWMRTACEQRPLLLVIEDLHWADEASILLVDAALGALAELPLMVLALARPEVRARRPWAARRPHELRLDPLAKRASERLVRDALGALATDEIVSGILARAEGNALFLEELVRAAANPNVTALPVGVIGTLQLRFDSLRAESRTVLRASSVYGERFRTAWLDPLVPPGIDVAVALSELTTAEVIASTADGYAFRHALVREAAYAMLPDDDRTLVHALAAAVLEADGEHDPQVIAQHYELGKQWDQAARWYTRAAEHALAHNDLDGAIAHATHAQTWTDDAAAAGRLDLIVADAQTWLGNLEASRSAAIRATTRIPTGATEWLEAAGLAITSAGQLGDNRAVEDWLGRVIAVTPESDGIRAYVQCLTRASSQLAWGDSSALALDALARADALSRGHDLGPTATARLLFARAVAAYVDGRVDRCGRLFDEVTAHYESIGAKREALQARLVNHTMGNNAGGYEDMLVEHDRCIAEAEAMPYVRDWARWERALAMLIQGRRADAAAELAQIPERIKAAPLFDNRLAILSLWAAMREDDVDAMPEYLGVKPCSERYRAALLGFAAFERFGRGDHAAACEKAREAIAALATAPGMLVDVQLAGYAPALTVLVRANTPDARSQLDAHLQRIDAFAARLEDTEVRRRFRESVPWNRYVRELAALPAR